MLHVEENPVDAYRVHTSLVNDEETRVSVEIPEKEAGRVERPGLPQGDSPRRES